MYPEKRPYVEIEKSLATRRISIKHVKGQANTKWKCKWMTSLAAYRLLYSMGDVGKPLAMKIYSKNISHYNC